MNILFVEPYYGGSHKLFLDQLIIELEQRNHQCHSIKLSAKKWRWRFLSSHFQLAEMVNNNFLNSPPEIIVCSSLMDTASFKGLLLPHFQKTAIITFFHENQMAYPINESAENRKDQIKLRKYTYPLVHLNQILGSDGLLFNSKYNHQSLFEGVEKFIRKMPDANPKKLIEKAKKKCFITGLGLKMNETISEPIPWDKRPMRILWNHRWEYDKNPNEFIKLFQNLVKKNKHLELDILGEDRSGEHTDTFLEFKDRFPGHIKTFGGLKEREDYINQLGKSRLLPVTSHHDFFGLSVVDAILNGVIPLLPRRLSYPELIPVNLHQKLLYSDFKELCKKSSLLLEYGLGESEKRDLITWLRKYDWPHYSDKIINIFDDVLKKKNDELSV